MWQAFAFSSNVSSVRSIRTTNLLPPSTPDDEDGDGIVNADDLCPETPMGSHVEGSGERRGCAEGQTPGSQQSNDGDSDGVIDKFINARIRQKANGPN